MNFTVIIPARFASQRLPGKPLLDICGKSMVQRVYEQAGKSQAEEVIVATDDQRIVDAVMDFGGSVCMTSPDHPSGTDRLQEVVSRADYDRDRIVVNVQGDEPLVPPQVINQVAANLELHQVQIATLSEQILSQDDFEDPNVVKVVVGEDGCALYFSRAPIPFPRDGAQAGPAHDLSPLCQKHLGIYAYRVSFLNSFASWSPSVIEEIEKLEQLRALYHGVAIHVGQSCVPIPPGVDTDRDLQRVIDDIKEKQAVVTGT